MQILENPKKYYQCQLSKRGWGQFIPTFLYVIGARPFTIFICAAREGAERWARSQRGEKGQPSTWRVRSCGNV